ncbi:F-box/FBD/LRR-repeat protein At5g53840 [Linum perenne]
MKKKKEASTIADGDGSKEDDDRISSLPDEILHEILERLRSHKQSGKVSLLSKRWNHLWLSYPVLEFDCRDYTNDLPSESTMDSFIAAAKRKLSYSGLNSYIKSLRIVSLDSAFVGAILDLIQNREPEEIDMRLGSDSVIPTQLLNSSRLRTLMLHDCQLLEDQYKMINLRELHFTQVKIDIQVLNSLIAAAPLLEKLTLKIMNIIKRLEVCNNVKLKQLKLSHIMVVGDSIQIAGALESLESLSLRLLSCHDMEMICSSVLPSLKSVKIKDCPKLSDNAVNKLISKSPSLLSLRLVRMNEAKELKIESPTLEKLELEWCDSDPKRVMFYIDAPSLVNVRFVGDIDSLQEMSHAATNSFQAARIRSSTFVLSLSCMAIGNQNFKKLKEFLRKVTRKFQFVELQLHDFRKGFNQWDQIEDDSPTPTPVIERVEVNFNEQWKLLDQAFLNKMLGSCHPKYFSLRRNVYTNIHSSIKLINEVFMERISPSCKKIACKCWRRQLKDVKIVNAKDKDKEELINISANVLSTLQCKTQVLFKLI